MLRTPVRRAARLSSLAQRRLRHAGFDQKKKRWLGLNLGEQLSKIHADSLEPCAEPVTSASGFELLCSYSWKGVPNSPLRMVPGGLRFPDDGQQIYVPGEAPVVVQRKLPVSYPPRKPMAKVQHCRDANVARMPSYPFEPMFQSMGASNPGFRFDDVDLIINRNSLKTLFGFIEGPSKSRKPLRLDLALVHNTLIATPVWDTVIEASAPKKKDKGRHFEEFFTHNGLQDNLTHHRAIRYELGPLNCAVLLELDAGLAGAGEAMAHPDGSWRYIHQDPLEGPLSELADAYQPDTRREKSLFEFRAQQAFRRPYTQHRPCTEVIHGGAGTLSKDAAELYAGSLSWSKQKMIQLWLGRVPFLVLGKGPKGQFTSVDVIHAATHFAAFETQWQARLQKLVSLLRRVRELVGNTTCQKCTMIYDPSLNSNTLRFFSHCLPPSPPVPIGLQKHFWSHFKATEEEKRRGSAEDGGRARGSAAAAAQASF